jgi:hypothetical protein
MSKVKQLEKNKIANPLVVTSDYSKYFPSNSEALQYKAMRVLTRSSNTPKSAFANIQMKSYGGISVHPEVNLTEAIQPPYTDADLQLFEAGARRNWAVKASISVREHFTFGYGSELVVELAESERVGLTDEEIAKKVDGLTKLHKDIIQKAYDRDEKLQLMKQMIVFWWQAVTFGRGLIVKFFDKDARNLDNLKTEVSSLKPINTRRLGIVIYDIDHRMSFEGVVVDGQGLSKHSMIYGAYQDVQISPHTEGFGYSQLESIVSIAEELNIAVEEDFKEILKSAWLASIMFVFNTAGLKETDAKNKIQRIIDSIAPAKFIGINEDIQDFKQLDLNPDYNGLVTLVDSLETKIYKALNVPQFLVQSEAIANRATALQSASLFINGVITDDQQWMSEILSEQWYDPFVEQQLKKKKSLKEKLKANHTTLPNRRIKNKPLDDNKDGFTEEGETKFKIKRIFNQAKVADFIDLADALSKLFAVGVWDVQKVNEELGTEDVTPRVVAENEKKENEMKAQFNQGNPEEPSPKDMIKKNTKDEVTNLKTAMANINPKDYQKYKTAILKMIFEKIENKSKG